jgi:ankyrin repeat protein
MFAALNGHTETVKSLIDSGADVNVKTKYGQVAYGQTALMFAARGDHTKIAKILKQAGAKE